MKWPHETFHSQYFRICTQLLLILLNVYFKDESSPSRNFFSKITWIFQLYYYILNFSFFVSFTSKTFFFALFVRPVIVTPRFSSRIIWVLHVLLCYYSCFSFNQIDELVLFSCVVVSSFATYLLPHNTLSMHYIYSLLFFFKEFSSVWMFIHT